MTSSKMYLQIVCLIVLPCMSISKSCDHLTCAISNGNSELVAQLLKSGINPSADVPAGDDVHDFGIPPLALALQKGHESIALQLLAAGADPNLGITSRITALDLAARQGQVDVVKYILDHNLAPINGFAHDKKPFIPLGYAAARGHMELVRYLLRMGADPYATTLQGRVSVIDEPIALSQEHIIRIFLDHGFDFQRIMGTSDALHLAAANSNHATVEMLTKKGWGPNHQLKPGVIALEQAVLNCRHQERVVTSLLNAGADGCGTTLAGNSLFTDELAIQKKGLTVLSPLTVDVLSQSAAQCWPKDDQKQSQLRFGASQQLCSDALTTEEQIVCAIKDNDVRLLDKLTPTLVGRKITQLDNFDDTLDTALLRDSQEAVLFALDKVAPYCGLVNNLPLLHRAMVLGRFRVVNSLLVHRQLCPNRHGISELHQRVLELDYHGVKNIIDGGTHADTKDKFGFTPIMFALALGAEDLAYLLLENGAKLDQRTPFNHSLLHFATIGDAHFFGKNGVEYAIQDYDAIDAIDQRTPLLSGIAGECTSGLVSHLIWSKSSRCKRDAHGKNFWSYVSERTRRPGRRNWLSGFEQPDDGPCLDNQ